MKPENLGLRYIHKYAPDAKPIESDLMGAAFAIPDYAKIAAQMSADERNKMRALGWWKDFQLDHWVFIADYAHPEAEEREVKPVIKAVTQIEPANIGNLIGNPEPKIELNPA